MATKQIYLNGVIEWAHHLFLPDEYEGIKKWKVNFYPDEESQAVLKESGAKLRYKDGAYGKYISPRRDCIRDFKDGKGPQELTPPKVLDAEGNDLPEGVHIGNGSKGTLKLSVYDVSHNNKPSKGSRLEGVKITELVVYEKPENDPAPGQVNDAAMPF
jgi:hypothetical protein